LFLVQLFDGKDGRPKYPRRWVILPPFLWRTGACRHFWGSIICSVPDIDSTHTFLLIMYRTSC
jgi:hypothetical protein